MSFKEVSKILSSDGTFFLNVHSTYQMDENSPRYMYKMDHSEEIIFLLAKVLRRGKIFYWARLNLFVPTIKVINRMNVFDETHKERNHTS